MTAGRKNPSDRRHLVLAAHVAALAVHAAALAFNGV